MQIHSHKQGEQYVSEAAHYSHIDDIRTGVPRHGRSRMWTVTTSCESLSVFTRQTMRTRLGPTIRKSTHDVDLTCTVGKPWRKRHEIDL
jgi:hypothetical protein